MSNEKLSVRLSDEDMKILENLSAKQGLKKAEYIRMLLQTIHIAETTKVKEDTKGNITFNIGDYGFRLEKDFLEGYAKELEGFFNGIEKRMKKVILSKPKANKRLMMKQVSKSKKVA
jgi:hypothetical protein